MKGTVGSVWRGRTGDRCCAYAGAVLQSWHSKGSTLGDADVLVGGSSISNRNKTVFSCLSLLMEGICGTSDMS